MKRYAIALAAIGTFACQPKSETVDKNEAPTSAADSKDGTENQDTKDSTTDKEATPPPAEPVRKLKSDGPNSRTICYAPEGINNDPRSMPDMIKLINALPKPVTVACVVDALKGPFRVAATSSAFSAQPAYSDEAPRMFLFFEPLFISVVPTGTGGDMIEFGVLTEPGETVKGELAFPVKDIITEEAAYEHIKYQGGESTVCAFCHTGERPAPEGFPKNAYVSALVKPMEAYEVSVKEIEKSAKRCATQVLPECQVLEAVTSKGPLIPARFE